MFINVYSCRPTNLTPILKERELWDFEKGFQTEGVQNLLPVCPVNVGSVNVGWDHLPFPIFGRGALNS